MEIRREGAGAALPSMGLVRELTDQIVLDTVFERAPITRAEIAQHTGISKTTVSESVRRLEKVKLLLPAGEQRGRQGRVGTYYQVAADAGFVVAADLHPTEIRLCVADLFGRPLHEGTHQPEQPRTPERLASKLRRLVTEAISLGSAQHGAPLAISVSVANPVDPTTSAVIPLPDTPYPEGVFQPQDALADLADAPVLVSNDVNLAAVAERRYGAARDADSFAYVFIGAGMGMGLIIGDRLIHGAHGMAGEIGYLGAGARQAGPAGRHGFARAVAEAGFRPQAPSEDRGESVAVAREVFRRADEGDAEALAVIEQEGRIIGEGIANICAVADPDLVLLGGPIGSHPALLEPVRTAVDALTPAPPAIEAGSLGDSAPLRGALAVALLRARADLLNRAKGA